jgi:hypothetical protein
MRPRALHTEANWIKSEKRNYGVMERPRAGGDSEAHANLPGETLVQKFFDCLLSRRSVDDSLVQVGYSAFAVN